MKNTKTNRWTLTDKAKSQIPEWNKKWEKIILSTDPIDFDRARTAIYGMCEAAKLPMPIVVECLSPMQGAFVCAWSAAFWEIKGSPRDSTAIDHLARRAAKRQQRGVLGQHAT